MKDVKESLLERTSVRRYEREAIPQETMDFIYKAIENTPTSYNGQQFSVIDIDDQSLKEELYALTNQKQLKTCNRLLIFCSDYNKITQLARKKGFDVPPFTDTMDGTIIGIIDASLAMMSAVVAAGIPREHPDLKPKQGDSLVFHRNHYRQDTEELVKEMEEYDDIVRNYNRTRSGGTTDNDWCDHILDYYRHAMSYRILDYLRDQGYDIKR